MHPHLALRRGHHLPCRGRSVDGLASLGAYRFDDPAGEVGIETLLLDVAGDVAQVPMTLRPTTTA
jgi:Maltokinase N-terminal cap domain